MPPPHQRARKLPYQLLDAAAYLQRLKQEGGELRELQVHQAN
jgi:hypothetical protein